MWIEPESFEAETGDAVNAALINGQNFAGISLAYATRSIDRLEVLSGGELTQIEGILGDRPAIKLSSAPEGLLVLGYVSVASRISYKEWEKFETFAEKKGFENAFQAHSEMGIERDSFDEGYTRFSKSLVGVGKGAGEDQVFGFETEFVALTNPYATAKDAVEFQLLYQDAPMSGAFVDVYERDSEGTVANSALWTDDNGVVRVPVRSGHEYMLDSVIFRSPSQELLDRMDVDWETLWANVTFGVPEE